MLRWKLRLVETSADRTVYSCRMVALDWLSLFIFLYGGLFFLELFWWVWYTFDEQFGRTVVWGLEKGTFEAFGYVNIQRYSILLTEVLWRGKNALGCALLLQLWMCWSSTVDEINLGVLLVFLLLKTVTLAHDVERQKILAWCFADWWNDVKMYK